MQDIEWIAAVVGAGSAIAAVGGLTRRVQARGRAVAAARSLPEAPAPGGAMGWPFRRRGTESLRIQPVGADLHVVWRIADGAVAHLVTDDGAHARALYAWLEARFGTATDRVPGIEPERRQRIVRQTRAPRGAGRHLAVLARGEAAFDVVDVVHGAVRSAMRAVDAAEAAELFGLLVEPPQRPAPRARPPRAGRRRTGAAAR